MAIGGETHISTRRPSPPPEADFAIFIDFKRGEGSPQRVFQAADSMIRALQRVDRALCVSIDISIEPVMVLEEIESGSIKIWLRNVLQSTDDQALKKLDWKPAVGKYLVRAKSAYIKWSNKERGTLLDLAKELRSIARETDVRHLPDYAPPSINELAASVEEIDGAKSLLIEGDRVTYVPAEGEPTDFDLAIAWTPEELDEILVKEVVKFEKMPMNLIVKNPDYLGESKWDLRHGKHPISASIADSLWLQKFQARQIDVRPGDALKCLVTVENHYGYDNELIREDVTVTRVESVLENQVRQASFFDSKDS